MASIEFISAASIAGSTLALPAHAAGDLIVAFIHAPDGYIPAVPTGWELPRTTTGSFLANNGGGSVAHGSFNTAYRIASSSSEPDLTTVSSPVSIAAIVLRHDPGSEWGTYTVGAWTVHVAGTFTDSASNGTTLTYPDLSVPASTQEDTQWYIRAGGANNATNVTTNNLTGWTFRTGVANKGLTVRDSGGPITGAANSLGGDTQSVSPTGGWWTATAAVHAVDKPNNGQFFQFF